MAGIETDLGPLEPEDLLKDLPPGGTDMTATVTALIELAVDHGIGLAFLIVGGQVLLDRLNPLEYVASLLFCARRPEQPVGAHRLERETRPFANSRLTSNFARHRNEPVGCMK